MRHRYYMGAAIAALSWGLWAGCRSSAPAAKTSRPSDTAAGVSTASGSEDAAIEKLAEAHAHYSLGIIRDLDEEPEEALGEYSKAVMEDPANEELVLELTRRYLQRQEPENDKALEVLQRATSLPGASGALFARLGLVYSRLGKNDLAIEASKTAIQKAPRALAGYQNLFIIYLQTNQYPEALKVLNQAARQPGTDAEFLINLAELYANFARQAPGQKQAVTPVAVEILKRAAKLNPTDPRLRVKLADGFLVLEDNADAELLYLQLLQQYAGSVVLEGNIRAKLAKIYSGENKPEKAMEQMEALIRNDPANREAYFSLGRFAYDAKKMEKAEEYFQKALVGGNVDERVYYFLAQAQINLNKNKEALATLAKEREQFPGKPESFQSEFLTAMAYLREKDYTQAINHFTGAELIARAAEPQQLNEYFYFQLGAAYERKGDYDQAEQNLNKCLEMAPGLAEALNYLGYMWADRGVKLEKARELIEKAVKLEPKNAAYLDSLGWVLYKLNQPNEALPKLLKAIELSEEPDATLYDHLGDIYAAMKEDEKAKEAWRKSLAVEPNEAIKKKLEPISGQ
ncbi:MAG TPA: tetratricopeptide repeat protein [Verrucomicrobiae bacterium]|nr:tetratricopeptide repeat protein [Verrucomicrobiae bacterium]